ncbi:putative HD superfamily hydrolase of NAD metabolism [Lachnospiraceae bacterium RM5]|nr:putative HD superfamily hydrolase of NAD metabolism [Lachnospiraceae bacterium RM5]
MKRKEILENLHKELDDYRFIHTLGVAYTASMLAMAYNYNIDDAYLAGLLHDCAKCIPNDEKIRLCEENNIKIDKLEYENPSLLHAKLGEYVANKKYGIENKEILRAIRLHTTGYSDMTLLDKIIYVADYIEPKRDKARNLEYYRDLAFKDLDKTTFMIIEDTINYNKEKGKELIKDTLIAYEYFIKMEEVK